MEEWEYRVTCVKRGTSARDEEALLNGLGREGWELVSTFWSEGSWHYLKRRRPPAAGAYRAPGAG